MATKELHPLELIHIPESDVLGWIDQLRPSFVGDATIPTPEDISGLKDVWFVLYAGYEPGTDHRHGDEPAYNFITAVPYVLILYAGLESTLRHFIRKIPINTNAVYGSFWADTITVVPQDEYRMEVKMSANSIEPYIEELNASGKT
jgi:hypothetical protein